MSPAATAVQRLAETWVLELLDLPRDASVGVTTGAQMANATCLATARHRVLADAGWDVEADGLAGAPPVTVVVGEHRHSTIDRAVRLLGSAPAAWCSSPPTTRGGCAPTPSPSALDDVAGPLIVCAQAGEVNTGAFDPFDGHRAADARSAAAGSTSTAPSGCGRGRAPTAGTSPPAPRVPTRGASTGTSG